MENVPTPESALAEITFDTDLAAQAIAQWKATLNPPPGNTPESNALVVQPVDFETLQRFVVDAIRTAKRHVVESCGLAYYEVNSHDFTRPEVLAPILMDRRRVVLQYTDENLRERDVPKIVENWTAALRPKTEYRDP